MKGFLNILFREIKNSNVTGDGQVTCCTIIGAYFTVSSKCNFGFVWKINT